MAALRERGVDILLVEQKVAAVLRVADRVAVIENGHIVHQAPAELSAEPDTLLRYGGVRRWPDRRCRVRLQGPGRSDRIEAHPSRPRRDDPGPGMREHAMKTLIRNIGTLFSGVDVPLHFKDAAFVRTHVDALEVRPSDAPKANEILVALVVTDGGRPHPRVGGLAVAEAEKEDGLR